MLLDILNEDNSISINLKAIKIFGLSTAAYLTELISIYKKAFRKNKLKDNYFKVDRKYITDKLGLSVDEQLVCDANLQKTSILKYSKDNPNELTLDLQLYLSSIASEDVKLIDDVRKQMKVLKPKNLKISQRQLMINELKNSIVCSNYELLTALRDWVDGVYARPGGFLSKSSIKLFQDTLNNYTQGDLDLALAVVRVATIQGYRDCTWAINLYESNKSKVNSNINKVRTTDQNVATEEDLGDVVF